MKEGRSRSRLISFLYTLKGEANIKLNLFKEAVDDCEIAKIHDEENALAYYTQGRAYANLGSEPLALMNMKIAAQKGLRIAKEFLMAYNIPIW